MRKEYIPHLYQNKITAHQLREHEKMRAAGIRVEAIDSFEQVDKLVGEIK